MDSRRAKFEPSSLVAGPPASTPPTRTNTEEPDEITCSESGAETRAGDSDDSSWWKRNRKNDGAELGRQEMAAGGHLAFGMTTIIIF